MAKTDTEFKIWTIVNMTESQYTAITKTDFIEPIQEIPGEEEG